CLSNSWGDFDNDGYLDVVITSETKTYFFHNNGDGTFSSINNSVSVNGSERGVTIGDYDNDGDLDIFIIGGPAGRGLFKNGNQNSNNWVILKLTGTQSNKSAIGTRISLKADLNGTFKWQMREIAAQNSFNSQNSLDVHFGLSNAAKIDSIIIYWPSGISQIITDASINSILEVTESGSTRINENSINSLNNFTLEQNYPNPFNPVTNIKYTVPEKSFITIKIFNLLGELKNTLVRDFKDKGDYNIEFNAEEFSSGIYFYVLQVGKFITSKKMVILK
ncbi:MAG TPA: ASPIC/UnbV domain-containing protein, partial [Ignavibacteriaceae bacterium]|nr:ASPIC/UnbV domain-containing protein [Ignavibacteriaceae bacterium]